MLILEQAGISAPAAEETVAAGPGTATAAPAPAREIGPAYDGDARLPQQAERVVDYELSARLDAATHTVFGEGTLRFRNTSAKSLEELWFHLYLNGFKHEKTLFLRSPFVTGRSRQRARDWGYIDVKKLLARELDGKDLWPNAARHSPGDPDDETDIRVPLPTPLEPGQTLTLEVVFESRLPEILERTGYSGSFHLVAQWFPKLARLEPDGSFAHFAFHPHAEFYADFGRYAVTLDVPETMKVGATGVRVWERVEAGRRKLRHEIDSVHDFAWTAWDAFHERAERIDGVDVRLLFPRGHERNAETTLGTLRHALPHFSRRYGRYPYPVLWVVHPPDYARDAGGMEYPTLITTGGPWYVGLFGVRSVEGVTVHELGHQWFYGLVATNEQAWPFLDEGVNSYVEGVALGERHGNGSGLAWPGLEVSEPAVQRAFAAELGRSERIAQSARDFSGFTSIAALVYGRTATVLHTLSNVYGAEKMERALGRYSRHYRFRHPGPEHFLAAVQEVMGDDARRTLERALFERASVDFELRSVESAPMTEPAGVFEHDAGREVVKSSIERAHRWRSRVVVHRRGELELPVEIELVDADGVRQRRHWDGRSTHIALEHEGPSPLETAVVDPDARITLDDDLLNNAARRGDSETPRAGERALYFAQLLLGWFGP
jgi:hypothetical protein